MQNAHRIKYAVCTFYNSAVTIIMLQLQLSLLISINLEYESYTHSLQTDALIL